MRFKPTHLLLSLALLVIAAVLVYVLARGLDIDQSKPRSVLVGKPAPAFVLQWLQGDNWLRELQAGQVSVAAQGKVLVLNFWASWCFSCRQESQLLQALWEKEQERVLVVGVAVHDEEAEARSFAQKYHKTYPLGLDSTGSTAIDYGVTGVPETYVIDAAGVVRLRNIGAVSAEFLQQVYNFFPKK